METESPLRGLVREDYPSNSLTSKPQTTKKPPPEEREKKPPVAKGKLIHKDPNVLERFLGDDLRSIFDYVIRDVLFPGAKNLILDGLEYAFFHEVRGKRFNSSSAPPWYTYVNPSSYFGENGRAQATRISSSRPTRNGPSRRDPNRQVRSVSEVFFETKWEAEQVVENMTDIISDCGEITIGEFYEAAGLPTVSTDFNYGWTDISNVRVIKTRDGWAIRLPKEEYLK